MEFVRNSPREEVQPVGQDPILWQWDPTLLLPLGTFTDTRGKMQYNRFTLKGVSPFIPDIALDVE